MAYSPDLGDPWRGLNRGRTPESGQDPATRVERLLIAVPSPRLEPGCPSFLIFTFTELLKISYILDV